jgi:hypothetical protein
LTILDTVYLWHGCGSTDAERQAAVQYASRISKGETNAIQLYEGENDQDELFWMALGNDEFAKANYWQWRRQASDIDPRIWRVSAKANPPVCQIQFSSRHWTDITNRSLKYNHSERSPRAIIPSILLTVFGSFLSRSGQWPEVIVPAFSLL